MLSEDFVNMFDADRFSEACRSFFSYTKVKEVYDRIISLRRVRDTILERTMETMAKASACEHIPSLEGYKYVAYSNAKDAPDNYSNMALQLLVEYAKSAAIEGAGDILKNKGRTKIGKAINNGIDKLGHKLNEPIQQKIQLLQQEMDCLEVSLLALAVCARWNGDCRGALSQLDEAVSVHLSPWMNLWDYVQKYVKMRYSHSLGQILSDRFSTLEDRLIFQYGGMYYYAMKVVEEAGGINDIDSFPNYAHMKRLASSLDEYGRYK